jgi:LacI family transcriptional regulator
MSLPRDLSVAGFDDTALASQLWPPLTTVRQPTRDLAYAATDLLFEGQEDPVHRRLAHELVLRASTTAPRPE